MRALSVMGFSTRTALRRASHAASAWSRWKASGVQIATTSTSGSSTRRNASSTTRAPVRAATAAATASLASATALIRYEAARNWSAGTCSDCVASPQPTRPTRNASPPLPVI